MIKIPHEWEKRLHVRSEGAERSVVTLRRDRKYGPHCVYGHGSTEEEAEAQALQMLGRSRSNRRPQPDAADPEEGGSNG
jgi:hypothetical protein